MIRPSPIALALLAVASATPPCEEGGSADYATYSAALSVYYAETALLGGSIGQRSEGCDLPIARAGHLPDLAVHPRSRRRSPSPAAHQSEMRHLTRLEASSEWLRLVGGNDGGNVQAAAALATMECHLRRAAQIACEEERGVAYCAHTQYRTWVRVAFVLADLALNCGSGAARRARATTPCATPARRFGAIVDTIPDDGVRGAARHRPSRSSRGRGAVRRHVPGNASASTLRALDTLSRQGRLAWPGRLLCAPRCMTALLSLSRRPLNALPPLCAHAHTHRIRAQRPWRVLRRHRRRAGANAYDLEDEDGCRGKYTAGLGQQQMGVCDQREDATSMMTAVARLLARTGIAPATASAASTWAPSPWAT